MVGRERFYWYEGESKTMWLLSLEWLLLAVTVFWALGAFKRLRRLRVQAEQAFTSVDGQFLQVVELLRSCARMQALKEKVATVYVQQAHHALLPSADLMESALQQARQHPLRPESIAALSGAWQGVQVAWQAYAQLCSDLSPVHEEHIQEWSQRWQQLQTLQSHNTSQFNTAVQAYNDAIAQFPACAMARIGGHKAGRIFQKDAA